MKSSRPASAHWRSSNTSTVGYGLGEALEEEAPGGEQVLALARRVLAEPEQLGQPRLDEARAPRRPGDARSSVARSFAERRGSVARPRRCRQRMRTMSASAQYATPSP